MAARARFGDDYISEDSEDQSVNQTELSEHVPIAQNIHSLPQQKAKKI